MRFSCALYGRTFYYTLEGFMDIFNRMNQEIENVSKEKLSKLSQEEISQRAKKYRKTWTIIWSTFGIISAVAFIILFCCMPFGIVGIVKAASVSSLYESGSYEDAVRVSLEAKKWTDIGFTIGMISWLLYIAIYLAITIFAVSSYDLA